MNMTDNEAIETLKVAKSEIEWEYPMDYQIALDKAIKALKQESVLDKIYADIQRLRGCSCWCSDGIIDDIEDILDKYRAESGET